MRRLQASFGLVMALVLVAALLAGSPALTSASDDSAAPKFSTFASAADLTAEMKSLVADLEKAVVDEEEFKDQVEGRFVRDGNTITLIAIALGLHDQDSPLKPHAKAIAAAARKLALVKANDFAGTKQAVADLTAAFDGHGGGGDALKWGKVSKLSSLMKDEVPHINTKLQTGLRHFATRPGEVASNAAAMALIADNAVLYVADTKQPNEGAKWTAFAAQMRSLASDVAAKAHAGDEAGAKAAAEKLNDSCTDCHRVFNPEKK